jgi:chromosomal replication initiator protein
MDGNGVWVVSGIFSIPLDAYAAASTSSVSTAGNPRLREFIADDDNFLARVTVDAILGPTTHYNPLVLFGTTGTGKSCLAHGLVSRFKQAHPNLKAISITGADFARAYATALETDSLADLRSKYGGAHLLLLEDLHELSTKRSAQQELATVIDDLLSRNRRILVTSRQAPAEMSTLAGGLASRLSTGLTVPLAPPGVHARREIIARLANQYGLAVDRETLDVLAGGISGTVSELNHAILQLKTATGDKPSIDAVVASRFLQQRNETQRATLRSITTRVADYFHVKSADLKGPTRRQSVVRARGLAMYLARRLTGKSLEQVGRHYGGRDHTTVLHACRKTEALLDSDPSLRQAVEQVMERLGLS